MSPWGRAITTHHHWPVVDAIVGVWLLLLLLVPCSTAQEVTAPTAAPVRFFPPFFTYLPTNVNVDTAMPMTTPTADAVTSAPTVMSVATSEPTTAVPVVVTDSPTAAVPVVTPTTAPLSVTGLPTTIAPVTATTVAPTMTTTTAPTATSSAPPTAVNNTVPTTAPTAINGTNTTAPPTSVNATNTTAAPTAVNGTNTNTSSSSPTAAPTSAVSGMEVNETIDDGMIWYPSVGNLSDTELRQIEMVTEMWFNDYFKEDDEDKSNSTERRRLVRSGRIHDTAHQHLHRELVRSLVRNMTMTMDIQSQNFTDKGNLVTFSQRLQYVALPGADTPGNYSTLPFRNEQSNAAYLNLLKDNVTAFATAELPVIGGVPPAAPGPAPSPSSSSSDSDGLSGGAIAGIVIAVVVVIGAAVFGGALLVQSSQESSPPSAEASKSANAKSLPQDLYSSYKPAPAETVASSSQHSRFVVDAPPGKLGFVVDNPDPHGPPVVHSVKEDSLLLDQIQVGDQLIKIDEVDLMAMPPREVVNLLIARKNNPTRKLTFARDDGTTTTFPNEESKLDEELDVQQNNQFVVMAPAGKLGVLLYNPDVGPPAIHTVKPDSVLMHQVEVDDRLLFIDEVNVSNMSPTRVTKILSARKDNPTRKLTLYRGSGPPVSTDGSFIVYAPPGKLGVLIYSTDDDGAPMIHTVKEDSVLMEQVHEGDQLISIDDIDVRSLSPTEVTKILTSKKNNATRRLTLTRGTGEGSLATVSAASKPDDGRIVVTAPPGKLGIFIHSADDGSPVVHTVKEYSVLIDQVKEGDRLLSIDEINVQSMTPAEVTKILVARKTKLSRTLVLIRDSTEKAETMDQDDLYVVLAPPGRLGVVLDNPDDGAPVVHAVKDYSVLVDQLRVGDRLVSVDEIDVSNYSPGDVVNLLSARTTNPTRKLTLTRAVPATKSDTTVAAEPEGEVAMNTGSLVAIDNSVPEPEVMVDAEDDHPTHVTDDSGTAESDAAVGDESMLMEQPSHVFDDDEEEEDRS